MWQTWIGSFSTHRLPFAHWWWRTCSSWTQIHSTGSSWSRTRCHCSRQMARLLTGCICIQATIPTCISWRSTMFLNSYQPPVLSTTLTSQSASPHPHCLTSWRWKSHFSRQLKNLYQGGIWKVSNIRWIYIDWCPLFFNGNVHNETVNLWATSRSEPITTFLLLGISFLSHFLNRMTLVLLGKHNVTRWVSGNTSTFFCCFASGRWGSLVISLQTGVTTNFYVVIILMWQFL